MRNRVEEGHDLTYNSTMREIITTPNPILLEKAEKVKSFDKHLQTLIKSMSATLDATRDPVGVGLAAPQVGISKRIFLSKPKEDGATFVFINPEILSMSESAEVPIMPNSEKVELMKKTGKKPKKGTLLEGCLSIPNIWGNVTRNKKVKLSYQDESGKKHVKTFTGFGAIIVQHELDHLNGVLFTKHVIAQGEQLYRSHKNKEGEDEFEEINV